MRCDDAVAASTVRLRYSKVDRHFISVLTEIGRLVRAGPGATAICLLQTIRMVDDFM